RSGALHRGHEVMELRGRVAVVTGASSGLGRRFALDLTAAGARVVALARRADLLAQLNVERTEVCDVRDTEVLRALLAQIGDVDILINNAGIGEPDDTADVAAYRDVFDTNFFAAVAATLAVLPGMRARGRGVIVCVSSD